PHIFHVNWFRRNKEGNLMWPGFGENMRVLEWIVDRCHGRVAADETRIGWMPRFKDFDIHGLNGFNEEKFNEVQNIDNDEWHREALSQEEFFMKLWSHLPKELMLQRELLVSRL
ncbi:MAG: phosphoenolpyruvate carboxykinase domain-containing protein, partial [Verrucomicrobiota bacterium]